MLSGFRLRWRRIANKKVLLFIYWVGGNPRRVRFKNTIILQYVNGKNIHNEKELALPTTFRYFEYS